MGEITGVGGGPLGFLLSQESRRKGLPLNVAALAALKVIARASNPAGDAATELSIVAVRGTTGEILLYPAAEEQHPADGPVLTIVPARLEPALARATEDLARRAVEATAGVGVFQVFLAVDRAGTPVLREVVPGLSWSGCWTIEACRSSQFEQHLRAAAGMPPGDAALLYAAVSVPLLGAPGLNGDYRWEGIAAARSIPGVSVHLYDETLTAPGKRLGHVTLTDVNDAGYRDTLIHRADSVRRMIVQKETRK